MVGFLELGSCALAAFRLTIFLVDDYGPFDIAEHWRNAWGVNNINGPLTGWAKLWSCYSCVSIWAAMLMFGIWELGDAGEIVVGIAAVAGLALVLRESLSQE
jgi:hypothetical protein